jgi:hypothetical protein
LGTAADLGSPLPSAYPVKTINSKRHYEIRDSECLVGFNAWSDLSAPSGALNAVMSAHTVWAEKIVYWASYIVPYDVGGKYGVEF